VLVNAGKWGKSQVRIGGTTLDGQAEFVIEDAPPARLTGGSVSDGSSGRL
jgi:hypothetical protein